MRRVLLPRDIADLPMPAGAVVCEVGGRSMGTDWSVRLVEGGATRDWLPGLQGQLDAVVAQMSHWEADSDLGRFNRAAAGSWHTLPPAFFDVLSFAQEVARASGGAYDPGAGALVDLWGFGPRGRFDQPGFSFPAEAQIVAALGLQRARRLELDAAGRRARQPGGMRLDLSAVAKGYAVDRLAWYLQSRGVAHYLVEVGGELRGAGFKPDGQPWWVALEQVEDAPGAQPAPLVLALHGLSVATSGDYRRYFDHGGRRYCHTIDPRDGCPIGHRLASVTVLHPQCMAADAWSTALGVLGPEAGMALAEAQGLAARFVRRRDDGGGVDELLSTQFQRMMDTP